MSRDQALLRLWIPVVAGAELVGFAVPATVGVLTVDAPPSVSLPAVIGAGAVEGVLLGAGQGLVLRRCLPAISLPRWVTATAAGATLAYVLGLLPSTTASLTAAWPVVVTGPLAVVLGLLLLASIGGAQWLELRHHVRHAGRWVGVTALAWLLGLAVFVAVAVPLWHPGQTVAFAVLVGLAAGALMALVMAAVTGLGLVRLVRPVHPVHPSPAPGAPAVALRPCRRRDRAATPEVVEGSSGP